MSVSLKPCPFCGGAAILDGTTYKHHLSGEHYYALGCRTQGCFGYIHNFSAAVPQAQKMTLVNAWNRRPQCHECGFSETVCMECGAQK